MSQEYKYVAKISADTSELEKVLSKAQGKLQRLSEDEVLIKLDYDGNIAAFNKTFNKMLKAAPELTIQFQYDVNKKILDQEINKLQQLTDLKLTIDEGSATAKVKSMLADLDKAYFNDAKESELYSRIDNIIRYANTISGLGAKLDNSWLTEIENYADAGKSINDLLQKNAEKPLKLFEIDTSLDDTIKKTQDRINEFQDVLESLKKKGASELSETNEFKELSDQVKILTADIAEMKQQLGNLSGEAFDDMSESVGRLEEKLGFALQRIQELKEANVNPNNLSFHVGELEDDKFRWKSESMNRVIQNMNWGNFGRKEKGGIGLGYGILGTGVYHTPKIEEIEIGGDNPKGYALNIDPSKYNLLIRNTTKEATKLLKFLSAFQGFTIARGSGYSEWDEALKGVDVKSLYKQFVDVFGETAMDIKEFSDFVDSMLSQVSEMAKFGFDNKGNFKLSGTKWDHADTPVTQLLKKLGYEGIDLRGTYWDSYEQGSTIFDLHPEDIIKSFDSQEKMESYWEKNQKAIKEFKTDASKALGEAGESIVKLTKYVEELNDKLDMLASKVNAISDAARITSATSDITSAAVEGMKDGQHSHSPSVDGENEGDNLVDGYVGRIRERIPEARAVGEALSKSTVEGLDKGSDIKFFSDESGQLSFIEKINNAEKELAETMDKVSESAKESTEQIEGQLSLDFSKAVEGPKKYELAIVKTTDVLYDLQESAKKAFNADIGQGSIFKINELLKDSYAKTQESLAQKNRAEEIKKSESAIRDYISEIEKATDKTDEFASSIKKAIDVSKKADAGSSIDLLGDLQENVRSDTEHARKDIERLLKSIEKFEDVQKYTSSFIDRVKQVEFELKELAEQEFISPEKVSSFEKLVKSLRESAKFDYNKNFKELSRTNFLEKISQYLTKYTGLSKSTRAEIENIALAMQKANDMGELKKLYDDFLKIKIGARQAGEETQSMFTKIGNRLDDMNSKFIAQFLSWQDLIRYARELADNVIALDSAITELRKVSDASSERLSQSFEKSTQTAMDLGQSIEHVINVTADWSRLGYDVDAAEELAKVTTLFTTVGDNMSSDDASSYLISTLQGYQLAADQAEDIVDKYNQVANRFAIDTAGIGEALQRSAASFNAANTDLSESIALITATNEVVQNPESVGTLWKTLSARIRGAKTELEELGEETDAYTETTSTLRDLVQGLTGFDIMKSETEFKSIYDIILGIGEAWDDLTDVERASLGEALAGKRNANALYAVLGNLDTLKDAYKEAEEASGSAAREQENHAKSVQYSLDRFQASIERISYDVMNSDFLKSLVESGVSLLDILDAIISKTSGLVSILAGVGTGVGFVKIGGLDAFNNLIDNYAVLNESISRYNTLAEKAAQIGKTNIAQYIKADNAMGGYLRSLNGAQASLKGYVGYLITAKAETIALRTVTLALDAALTMGISAAVTIAVSWITDLINSSKEARETAVELADVYESESKSLNEQIAQYQNLSSQLREANKNGEDTYDIKSQLLELQKELNEIYGNEYDKLNLVNGAYSDQIAILKNLSKDKAIDFLSKNSDQFDEMNKYLDKTRTYRIGSISTAYQSDLLDILDNYENINIGPESYGSRVVTINADIENADKIMQDLYADLEEYGKTHNLDVSWLTDAISIERRKISEDDTFSEYKKLRDSYVTATIAANEELSSSFSEAVDAVDNYNKALESGEGVEAAKDNLDKIQTQIENTTFDSSGIRERFLSIFNGIDEELEKRNSIDKAFASKENDLMEYAEKLKGLTDLDLSNLSDSETKATFNYLLHSLGLTEENAGLLIDKLVELEIVQRGVANSAKEMADAESVYASAFSDFSETDIGERLKHLNDLFNEGEITYRQYMEGLQTEFDNFDASSFTNTLEDAKKAEIQFFADSAQVVSQGLSDLYSNWNAGNIDVNEYLDSYLSMGSMLSDLTDRLQENSAAWNENGEAISDSENKALDETQELLSSSMAVIESFQDSIYSLTQINSGAIKAGTDEYSAHLQIIAEDVKAIIDAGGEDADILASRLGTTTAEIAQSMYDNVANLGIAEQGIMNNTNNAITNMATAIGDLFDTLGEEISNFKVDLKFSPKFDGSKTFTILGKEFTVPQIKFELAASGKSLTNIGNAIKSFGTSIKDNIGSQLLTLEDFHISEPKNTDTASKRYGSYVPKNAADSYDKTLEKVKEASKAASGSAKEAEDSFEELYDYFERMIKVLDNSVDLLEAHLEDVVGSFAKNSLLDAEEDLIQSKMNGYSSAIEMYSQKASEALSKIPSDIAEKIQNGAVDIDEFIGENNKDVVEAIQEYEKWADKVQDCKLQIVQLKEAIRKLELDKFNNVMQDFTDQFDLRQSAGIDLISKQIDLLKEAGELIGESFYKRQQEQAEKQLDILTRAQEALVKQLNEALSRGVDVGSEEWLSMVDSLTETEGKIIDCKKAIEEFDNAILELHTEIFNRIQDQFSAFASELSNMQQLINDDANPVATVKNQWTDEGLAQLGLLAQQYELAKYQVAQYNEEIERLNQLYLQGKYSTTEYADKLIELKNAQWEAVNASESALDSIRSLNQERVNIVVEGINEEIEAFEKLTNAQLENLKATKDLHDYQKSIAETEKDIVSLQKQLAAIQDDESAAAIAKRAKLQEQLAEKQSELEEKEYDHSISQQEDALSAQLEQYKEIRQQEIDALNETLLNVEQLLSDTFEAVRNNSQLIGETILAQAQAHGIEMSEVLTNGWFQGENAIAHYGELLTSASSNFIGQIQGVEYQVYELQNQANATADGLAYMFSTRADNLVDELVRSYTSEANLDAMTNALHDSLSNTIDGNYSGASAAAALNSIADAANGVAEAASNAANELAKLANTQSTVSVGAAGQLGLGAAGNLIGTKTRVTSIYGGPNAGKVAVWTEKGGSYKFRAKGSKSIPSDELAWTQENGPEMIISPSDGAILTPLKRGDAVLPTDQTSNIWEWSRFNPEEFASKLIQSIGNVEGGKVQTNTMQVGSVVTINGPVNDTVEMVKIASQEASVKIKQSFNELSNSLNR